MLKPYSVLLAAAIPLVTGACWGGYRPAGPLPDLTPGIRLGAEVVTVETVFEDPELTPWKLSFAPCGGAGEDVVVASGGGTVAYLTPEGALLRRIRTDRKVAGQTTVIGSSDLVPVQADDDPGCELMDPGGGWRVVGLLDVNYSCAATTIRFVQPSFR